MNPPTAQPPSPAAPSARRGVLLEARWADAPLAAELIAPAGSAVLRITRVGAVALPAPIELACDASGAPRLRAGGDGAAWCAATEARPAILELGGLTVCASSVERERVPTAARPDGAAWGALLASLLVHGALATMLLVTSREDALAPRAPDLGALRTLIQHTTRRDPPARPRRAPPAAASSTVDELPDPRALDEPRTPRTRGPLRGGAPSSAAALVVRRGVLGAVWTPALRRAMARTHAAFASMTRAGGAIDPGPSDRQTYGHLGGAGTGAGAGCGSPEECATVAVGPVHEDTGWGLRGAVAAAQPMQQRASATPALAAAPPPVAGELDTAFVRQMVRRELLAGVQRCYSDRLAQAALESGRVVVRFAVAPDGRVSGATIVSSAIRDAPTERCITGVINAAAFPAVGAPAEVTYPFVFTALMPDR